MEIAERLYQKGFISYPRTETDSFAKTINLQNLIQIQGESPVWGEYVSRMLSEDPETCLYKYPKSGGHDDKAHPPIHPVKLLQKGETPPDEWAIYELVTRHFLACCSKDALGEETYVEVKVHEEHFHARGLVIKQYNYLEVYPYDKWYGNLLPVVFQVGDQFPMQDVTLKESVTTPPTLLTEPELITLMDSNGIGTDATIHEHIKTIQERGYAQKANGNQFKPTSLGVSLVEAYQEMGYDLAKPRLRAKMEDAMSKIARGELTKEHVINSTMQEIHTIFVDVASNKKEILIKSVRAYYQGESPSEEEDKSSSVQSDLKCTGCGESMLIRTDQFNRQFVCEPCDLKLSIPKNNEFRILNDKKCPLCNFNVLSITSTAGKEFNICPFCYSNIEEMEKTFGESLRTPAGGTATASGASGGDSRYMPCFMCQHKSCEFSAVSKRKAVMTCPDCGHMLTLRKTKNDPNRMFIGCETYPTCKKIISVPAFLKNVETTSTVCETCSDASKSATVYKVKGILEGFDTPFDGFPEEATGQEYCLGGCDENLANMGYREKVVYNARSSGAGQPQQQMPRRGPMLPIANQTPAQRQNFQGGGASAPNEERKFVPASSTGQGFGIKSAFIQSSMRLLIHIA
jgi:DNA topoisomerase-3